MRALRSLRPSTGASSALNVSFRLALSLTYCYCFVPPLSELPNLNLIIPALLEFGTEGLRDKCKLTPGVPLKPMLAKPTKAITEVLDRFEGKRFTCEYKYDGERAQVSSLRPTTTHQAVS